MEAITAYQAALELSRRHLLDFGIATERAHTPENFQINWHHKKIANALERLERGEINKLAIFMPPRSGKSLMSSLLFPAWVLGRNPTKKVILASYSQELATKFARGCRDIMRSEWYSEIFPGVDLRDDVQRQDQWELTAGGGYRGVGVGGSLSGFGGDFLIIDDVHKSRAEAESQTVRNNVFDWYSSTAYTRLQPDGKVLMVLTRWHLDDLPARLLAKGGWEVISFPAVANQDEEFRKAGEPLWPARFSAERLQETKETISVYDWNSLYQQNPVATENQEFKAENFRYFNESDLVGKNLQYYTAVDLAIGKGQDNDRTAIVTIGKEMNKPDWYIVDITVGRLDPLQTIDALFNVYERFRPVRVGIETVAYQKALMYFLREEMKRRQSYMPLVELKATTKKELRIRGLIPLYKTGVIHHRKGVENNLLEEELLTFPMGIHDDVLDALAYCLDMVKPTEGAKRVFYN